MKSLKGHLLVATPSLTDPNFHQTVVLVFDHSSEGAGGVVLNRPTGKAIKDVADQVFNEASDWDKPVHLGGPVPGPLAAAHTVEELSDLEVFPGLYGTVDPDKLRQIVAEQAEPTFFLANYAGWGPGQLERELEEDAWFVLPARLEHIFFPHDEDLWKTALTEIGYLTLGSTLRPKVIPNDPSVN